MPNIFLLLKSPELPPLIFIINDVSLLHLLWILPLNFNSPVLDAAILPKLRLVMENSQEEIRDAPAWKVLDSLAAKTGDKVKKSKNVKDKSI